MYFCILDICDATMRYKYIAAIVRHKMIKIKIKIQILLDAKQKVRIKYSIRDNTARYAKFRHIKC